MVPIFSYHEEAEMFLHLGSVQGVTGIDHMKYSGWCVRQSEGGELISLLEVRCAGIEIIALDPLPQMMSEMTAGPVSVLKERFIRRLATDSTSARRPPVLYDPDRGRSPGEGV
jgi:hypothetical protein